MNAYGPGVLVAVLALSAACGGESGPRFTEPMVLGGQEVSAEVLERGSKVYALYCSSCHGRDGSGQGNAARSLSTKPRDFRQADFKYKSTDGDALPTDEDLLGTVLGGRVDTGMPAWNGLTPEDRQAVVHYIKTFSPRWQEQKSADAKASP